METHLFARFEECGPAVVLPVLPVAPTPVPLKPPPVVVPWCLDESKSESILGSAALATRLLWGPVVPSGTPLLL